MKLTKTAYLNYLSCPREFWLAHHHEDLFRKEFSPETLHYIRMADGVEAQARALFAMGKYGAWDFQPTFESARLVARADIVATDPQTGARHIYEVKSSNSVKDENIHDLAFQKIAAGEAGMPIDQTYIVHMNREYVRRGEIEPEKLFTIVNLTEAVNEKLEETRGKIDDALGYLETQPDTDLAGYCGAKLKCKFILHHHPDLPEYTIFDINNFRGKKFDQLFTQGILDIMHVPADFPLTEKQRKQVDIAQSGEVYADGDRIKETVNGLEYPLYFLDYETVAHAVPMFSGYRPHQPAVFQFSLHIQDAPDSELRHEEFLAECDREPAAQVLHALKGHIEHEGGTVIVWNQGFESGRNREMSELYGEYGPLMESVNDRMHDLMKIFSDGLYMHPKFKGGASIKNVLPVLVEGYSYDELAINRGMLAAITWMDMHTGLIPRENWEEKRMNLFEYCGMDSRAMVEILGVLRKEFCA